MTSRHHYSIPGASLLKPRGSSKTRTEKAAATNNNVPSSSRDTRQSNSARSHYAQEAGTGNSPLRPPSASGYRPQHPNPSDNGFHASNNTRQAPAQRPTTTPPASSSRTRLDVPDPRSYLSKMFSRKQPSAAVQGEEKHKASHKQPRSSQVYPSAPGLAGASASRSTYGASFQARESDRDDRARQKAKEDRVLADRTKEERERMRTEYAAYKAKLEETERAQVAANMNRVERTVSRPSREERRQQEYESDNARRRMQAHQTLTSAQKQEARQSRYLHPSQVPTAAASRATAPIQQSVAPQVAARPPGVPVQPSTSSQATSVSQQAHALRSAPPLTRQEPTVTQDPVLTPTPHPESVPAPPPKANLAPYQASSQHYNVNPAHQTQVTPTAPNMLPPYQPSGSDRNRLDREAAERDALLTRERERTEREHELARREIEREAAEKEVAAARERDRERELQSRREAEKEAADRELQQHRERERERDLEREKRRARRAERERKKELENAERERRKELEAAERERQKQLERAERERLKALEQLELEKQKEAERTRRERKEYERAEKERLKAEWQRQQDERLERERLREKAEKERERSARSASKHRSHRDKSLSMPTNTLPGAVSGSDTDRMTSKKDGQRHRSQSQSAVAGIGTFNVPRLDSRKETEPASTVATAGPRKDTQQTVLSHHDPTQSLPLSPPSQADISNSRSASAALIPPQAQELTPPKMPERSRTDPLLSTNLRAGGIHIQALEEPWQQPFSDSEEGQSKLVSIYASQGPPDRTAYRPLQRPTPGQPVAAQRLPVSTPLFPASSNVHEGRQRPALDPSSHRASVAYPNTTPPVVPAKTPHNEPRHEPPVVAQEPSAAFSRHYMASAQPLTTDANTSIPVLPTAEPPHADAGLATSYGKALPSPDMSRPVPAAQLAHHVNSAIAGDKRPASSKPAAGSSLVTGFSSYSQAVFGLTKDPSRGSAHDQQPVSMSRPPSNNSTRSPSRLAAQLSADTQTGAFSGIPASRTASDASRSSGEHRQSSTPRIRPSSHPASSQNQQHPTHYNSATPMYSSTQNASLSSRVRHESVTNFHQQAVFPTHSHHQSLPQQSPSPYPDNASKDEIVLPRRDTLPNARAIAPIPASVPDASHHQYPSIQQSFSQSEATYNSSNNARLAAQSQQFQSAMSSQDHKQPLPTPMHTNNALSHSAAIASSNTLSQMPSTVLSHHQPTHPSNSSMYNNPSDSRNRVSIPQNAHHQLVPSSSRPTLPQHTNNPNSNALAKSSSQPRSANPAVYVTSTRKSGPFVEESPSSVGGGLSLDSPPIVKPPLQHAPHPTERPIPQSAYNKPQSQSGPPIATVYSSNQARTFAETEKAGLAQDADSPPPLTPSSSSHDSHDHEEILMTPASLDQGRPHVDVRQPPDSSQRSEKKKGGLLRLFRSSSTKPKEVRDRVEPREYESRRRVPVSQHDQRSESVNKPRSTRPPSIMITAEADSHPTNGGSTAVNQQGRQVRASRHVPPPIAIPPPQSMSQRIFFSKSKRYRTMSAASLEAVDGTANNTVVGSPTSSRRSPTPSGPLTPPIRDPMEAAQAWRNNEDVFLDPDGQRRRRPGVSFDLRGDDGQKDGAQYRRYSRLQRQRRGRAEVI